ncbi:MFS transporter [Gallibacterium genomosp. 2]|uniref:Probable sugar efflux transporter n=2 Tax=Gallibacterium TaxID=155493 RepID=A0A0A2XSS3_9PAST|nr:MULTISPECIES: sugar transporter [Gallibacterium]KGQ34057.1 MFS transporter [Gallibacterium genomosp. 2]KGQ37489.1 MFS transporter [Gallibacterium genomosp. 1]
MLAKNVVRRIEYTRVIVMAFAAFVFNTTEYIPVALLSDIAGSFHMPISEVGLMITVYAWIVALMSLPCMLMTSALERRSLLVKLFIVFIACHIISACAWNYWILLLSRAGIALTHSIFWSITASLVMRVAPRDKRTQALGLLEMGTALAMVLGLPLGRVIGQWLSWRTTFAIIAIAAIIIMITIAKLLPHLPSKNAGSIESLPILARRPMLMGIYLLTAIVIAAHFTAYSYIEPFMIQISHISDNVATAALLIFGLSGLVASLLFNLFYHLNPNKFLLSSMLILLLSLALLNQIGTHSTAIFLLVFIWGIGISALGLGMQMRVLQLSPDATDVATSIFSGIYNVGIGAGALIGNQVMHYLGLSYIGSIGALLAIIAVLWFIFIQLKFAHTLVKIPHKN